MIKFGDKMGTTLKTKIKASIVEELERAGYKTFFVGGCVRDELSGIKPHDYDLVTEAHPDEIKKVLSHFPLVDLGSSEKFGVVVVNLDGSNVEIATFRKDVECDGRKAKVELL